MLCGGVRAREEARELERTLSTGRVDEGRGKEPGGLDQAPDWELEHRLEAHAQDPLCSFSRPFLCFLEKEAWAVRSLGFLAMALGTEYGLPLVLGIFRVACEPLKGRS